MEGARLAGASRIFGVDINPAKYEQGTSLMNYCQCHLMCKMTVWYMVLDADGKLFHFLSSAKKFGCTDFVNPKDKPPALACHSPYV
jgi:Zn-dependent alcohol dehydrogenase